jgi:hypothetical protein
MPRPSSPFLRGQAPGKASCLGSDAPRLCLSAMLACPPDRLANCRCTLTSAANRISRKRRHSLLILQHSNQSAAGNTPHRRFPQGRRSFRTTKICAAFCAALARTQARPASGPAPPGGTGTQAHNQGVPRTTTMDRRHLHPLLQPQQMMATPPNWRQVCRRPSIIPLTEMPSSKGHVGPVGSLGEEARRRHFPGSVGKDNPAVSHQPPAAKSPMRRSVSSEGSCFSGTPNAQGQAV